MGEARIPNLNNIQLAGRVTWGPDHKVIGGDNALCKFGLAVNRKFRKNDGGLGEESLFINCEVWGHAADFARDDLYKGAKVIVEGSLKEDKWQKDGVDHTKMGIKVNKINTLEWKDKIDTGQSAPADDDMY